MEALYPASVCKHTGADVMIQSQPASTSLTSLTAVWKASMDASVAAHFVIHLSVMQSGRPLGAVIYPVQFIVNESKQNGSPAHAAGWGARDGLHHKNFGYIISSPPPFASFYWFARQEAEQFRGIMLSIHLNTRS